MVAVIHHLLETVAWPEARGVVDDGAPPCMACTRRRSGMTAVDPRRRKMSTAYINSVLVLIVICRDCFQCMFCRFPLHILLPCYDIYIYAYIFCFQILRGTYKRKQTAQLALPLSSGPSSSPYWTHTGICDKKRSSSGGSSTRRCYRLPRTCSWMMASSTSSSTARRWHHATGSSSSVESTTISACATP